MKKAQITAETRRAQRGRAANEGRRDKPRNTQNTRKTDFVPVRLPRISRIPRFISFPKIRRSLRRINAETQRFAEGRREGRKKRFFSSAFLRALGVSALSNTPQLVTRPAGSRHKARRGR